VIELLDPGCRSPAHAPALNRIHHLTEGVAAALTISCWDPADHAALGDLRAALPATSKELSSGSCEPAGSAASWGFQDIAGTSRCSVARGAFPAVRALRYYD